MLPGNARASVPRSGGIESVFLNIPYDDAFETLYLAYIVGLTQLGLRINATLAIPNQGHLKTIIDLIEQSNISIHAHRSSYWLTSAALYVPIKVPAQHAIDLSVDRSLVSTPRNVAYS